MAGECITYIAELGVVCNSERSLNFKILGYITEPIGFFFFLLEIKLENMEQDC